MKAKKKPLPPRPEKAHAPLTDAPAPVRWLVTLAREFGPTVVVLLIVCGLLVYAVMKVDERSERNQAEKAALTAKLVELVQTGITSGNENVDAQRASVESLKALNATVIKVAEDAHAAHRVPPPVPAKPPTQ